MKDNILDLIGNTELYNLSEINPNIYIKLENKNPGGSIKDRAVLGMFQGMEERGELKPGDKIVEATSGNTGIAAAMIGGRKGIEVTIIMPESMSRERRDLIKAYGAELILTDAKMGMQGSIDKMEELLATGEYKSLNQFSNEDNVNYHYRTTGPEIYRELPEIDIFVAGFGTGGTVSGTGSYLKEKNRNIRIVAMEPASSPLITEGHSGSHKIQGIGANFIPENLKQEIIDEYITVTDEEAFDMVRELGKKEGLLLGITSGANVAAALKLSEKYPDKKIVTVAPDGIDKYISMGIF